jgi:hypothetical protein
MLFNNRCFHGFGRHSLTSWALTVTGVLQSVLETKAPGHNSESTTFAPLTDDECLDADLTVDGFQ